MRGIIRKGMHVAKNCKAVGTKYGTIERVLRYLVITRSTGNHCMNGKCTWLSIGFIDGRELQKRWHKVSGEHRRVLSESSVAAGDHLA